MAVRVQVPLAVLKGKDSKYTSLRGCVLGLFLLQVVRRALWCQVAVEDSS